jgi:hypothetical protein
MGQIVFRVRDNKIGVHHCVIAVAGISFPGRRNSGRVLHCMESGFASRQTDKSFIKVVEPPAEYLWGVTRGIGGHENELHLIGNAGRQTLQSYANLRHVQGTLIGALGIAEKQERDRSLSSVPEIKRRPGGVRENKSWFGQGRRDQTAPVGVTLALLRRRPGREKEEESQRARFHGKPPVSKQLLFPSCRVRREWHRYSRRCLGSGRSPESACPPEATGGAPADLAVQGTKIPSSRCLPVSR